MARITDQVAYPVDTTPGVNDFLIGTDSTTNEVRTYPIDNIRGVIGNANDTIQGNKTFTGDVNLTNANVTGLSLSNISDSGSLADQDNVNFGTEVTNKPTTLSGYGITDAFDADDVIAQPTDSSTLAVTAGQVLIGTNATTIGRFYRVVGNASITSSSGLAGGNFVSITPNPLVTLDTDQTITGAKVFDDDIVLHSSVDMNNFDISHRLEFQQSDNTVTASIHAIAIDNLTGHNIVMAVNNLVAAEIFSNAIVAKIAPGFLGSSVAPPDAEILDDYEEGTWVPVITTVDLTIDSTTSAIYTKIGRLVTLSAVFVVTNSTDPAVTRGNYGISGAPFASSSNQIGSATASLTGSTTHPNIAIVSISGSDLLIGHEGGLSSGDTETVHLTITYQTNA